MRKGWKDQVVTDERDVERKTRSSTSPLVCVACLVLSNETSGKESRRSWMWFPVSSYLQAEGEVESFQRGRWDGSFAAMPKISSSSNTLPSRGDR